MCPGESTITALKRRRAGDRRLLFVQRAREEVPGTIMDNNGNKSQGSIGVHLTESSPSWPKKLFGTRIDG
jgi:hypothetical protein